LNPLFLSLQDGSQNNKKWAQLFLKSIYPDRLFDKEKWGWPINADLVHAELKNGTLVVFMAMDAFNKHEKTTAKQLLELTDDFVILSGDVNYFKNPEKHICFMPYWYLSLRLDSARLDLTPRQASGDARPYALSSLNGKSRYHRIENFIKLREKPYFNKLYFGMHDNWDRETTRLEAPEEYWDENIINKFEAVVASGELTQGHTTDPRAAHPAYDESYINYVTETSIRHNEIFCSEKVWKPLMAGQFGIWLSNPGTVDFLRSIGFDVFDDIFDNHVYDLEPNLHRRIEMIHKLIDKIMETDLTHQFKETVERRQANIDLFYSNRLEDLLTSQCKEYQL
jgi:hypothetical protein